MILKKLSLNGFKSFCDPTEINFVQGVTAVIGPNGSGKSNISDAIRWVVGEQKTKPLRVGTMTDIIFKGTESRKGLGRTEVKLSFINQRNLLDIDTDEVEISRVIFTSGESEYYINKQKVRLKDIQSLFYDTGVGKSSYSIMEQGKIDMILSNKPEDRRYIIEEAAGITKYKVKRDEANGKLFQSDENILRIKDIIKEVKTQFDKTKIQADKAEKYKIIYNKEIDVEIELNLNKTTRQKQTKDELLEKLEKNENELNKINAEMENLKEGIEEKVSDLNTLENKKIELQRQMFQHESEINTLKTKLSMYKEQLSSLKITTKLDLEKLEGFDKKINEIKNETKEVNRNKIEIEEKILSLTKDNDHYKNAINSVNYEIEQNNQLIQKSTIEIKKLNEQLEHTSNNHKEITDKLIEKIDQSLNIIEVNSDDIVNFKTNIRENIKYIQNNLPKKRAFIDDIVKVGSISDNSEKLLNLLIEFSTELQTIEHRINSMNNEVEKYIQTTEIFLDDVFNPEGILQTKRKIEAEMQNMKDKIKQYSIDIENARQTINENRKKKDEYRSILEELNINLSTYKEKKKSSEIELKRLVTMEEHFIKNKIELTERIHSNNNKITEISNNLTDFQTQISELDEKKANLNKNHKNIEQTIQEKNLKMSKEQQHIRQINKRWNDKKESIEKLNIKIAETNATIKNIYSNFYENFSINLTEYESKGGYISKRSFEEIREELLEIRRQKKELGNVNLMAIEEYKSLDERYNLLLEQLEDLEKARKDINVMINEINKTSEELFLKTFNQIKKNFHNMFRKLFNGGTAEIKLTNPDNLLETGIDLIAHPPGEKTKSVLQLSGGQRTLVAISLMFATFLVKPSPFCLLDEIDAALDEINVDRFIYLLKDFKETTQFIIITHNKKTIAAADAMYGITQEEKGVSKIVSAKFITKED